MAFLFAHFIKNHLFKRKLFTFLKKIKLKNNNKNVSLNGNEGFEGRMNVYHAFDKYCEIKLNSCRLLQRG